MKILLIHQYFLGKNAGGGARWNQMTRYWAEQGHEITVLAGMVDYNTGKKLPEYRGRFIARESAGENISVLRCHVSEAYNRGFLGRAWAYFSFAFSSILAGLIYASTPDVIIATSPPLTISPTMRWLAWLKRRPAIFEVRDLWPESAIDTGVLKPGALANVLFSMERKSYQFADKINVLTPAFREKLTLEKGVSEDKICMITNGADPDLMCPGPKHNEVRATMGLNDKFLVGYFGAHGKANQLGQLLDAASLLKNEASDVHIVLVGGGMEKESLIQRVQKEGLDNVSFIDPVPKNEVVNYINAMDVCTAVLMRNDTFKTVYPNKVFDYMCCTRPVLIGIDGVARKLVEDAQAGLFATPEDAKDIVSKILHLKQHPELCEQMGQSGRNYVLEHFSREQLAAKYLEIVKTVASQA